MAEGWRPTEWPPPQLTAIKNGLLHLTNMSSQPVILTDTKVNSIKITTTPDLDWQTPKLATITGTKTSVTPLSDMETINLIKIGETSEDIRDLLRAAHSKYRHVFSKDLTRGYNGSYGTHVCKLN